MTFSLKHKPDYEIGDKVKYISRDWYGSMRPGDIVTVLGIQDGIFPPDEYAVVETAEGRTHVAYTWRFEKYEEEENVSPTISTGVEAESGHVPAV